MKADLDTAFKGAAADALRATTSYFWSWPSSNSADKTARPSRRWKPRSWQSKTMLDPLKETLSKLDTQTREMEKRARARIPKLRLS